MDKQRNKISNTTIKAQSIIDADQIQIINYLNNHSSNTDLYGQQPQNFIKLRDYSDSSDEFFISHDFLNYYFTQVFPLFSYLMFNNVFNQLSATGYIVVNIATNEASLTKYALKSDNYNESKYQQISLLNTSIQNLGYLTLSQLQSVFQSINSITNLNMQSLYYVLNYRNLIDFSSTYDQYLCNLHDVKLQISNNLANYTTTANTDSLIQSLGYLTLSQNQSVFQSINSTSNLNLQSLYYVVNAKNLIDYSNTYNQYLVNNFDVKNQISNNNTNFYDKTQSDSRYLQTIPSQYMQTTQNQVMGNSITISYSYFGTISYTTNMLVTYGQVQSMISGSSFTPADNQVICGASSPQLYITKASNQYTFNDTTKDYICFTNNSSTYLKNTCQVLQRMFFNNFNGKQTQSTQNYVSIGQASLPYQLVIASYNSTDVLQQIIMNIDSSNNSVFLKNATIGSSSSDQLNISATINSNQQLVQYNSLTSVGTGNFDTIYLLQSPAGLAGSTGNMINILNHGFNTTYNNDGTWWNQRMNVFNRNVSGGNNNYYMSWTCKRSSNSSYNLFIEAYCSTAGFSSYWFKFNIQPLDDYNQKIKNLFSRINLVSYDQKRTRCSQNHPQPCECNAIKYTSKMVGFIVEQLDPEDKQFLLENETILQQGLSDDDLTQSPYHVVYQNLSIMSIQMSKIQQQEIEDLKKYQSFLQNMIIEQEQKICDLEKKNSVLEIQNSMILQRLAMFEERIQRLEKETIFSVI